MRHLAVRALLAVTAFACGAAPSAAAAAVPAPGADTTLARRLAAVPATLAIGGGRLQVVNLYKLQGEVLHATAGLPADSTIALLAERVYAPYTTFWNGYLGDEAAFRRWAVKLLDPGHPIHARMLPLLDAALDARFLEGVEWLGQTTGRTPVGTWYIVFGPGWTDMGGLGDIGMVADFTRMRPDSAALAAILPHELTHQVHGVSPGRAADPDAGTVLDRIVSEGFASYVSWVHGGGARSPAQALGYTDAEWAWALAHERELAQAATPIHGSRERDDIDRVASRSAALIDGAPGAAGYFLGFRIVEAYVARHGPASWKEIYDLPVAAVVARSRP